MASTSAAVVILDDEPVCARAASVSGRGSSGEGASTSSKEAGQRQDQKRRRVAQTEVVDLTSPTLPKKKTRNGDKDGVKDCVKVVKAGKRLKRKVPPPKKNPPLPDVFIAEQPRKKKPPASTTNGLECRICIDTMKQPTATPCGHVFCFTCLQAAMRVKKACPVCRKPIRSQKSIHRLYL
ncbi:RING/FYVE/PHD-type zinc finger domain-containing protein [Chloropicon primus]|uniref:RING/FYVE/PHD-type zinc finger domain-containing protein n=3 Tax=Chloropicon primus TaxID=1764295 RepID=A0A5B8MAZ2_9CHLO|nr:RING/FYVE/PHD-type zinc finger domain-containing protein [Chloropicon primus]UPQ96824.1 RING/FYVE/PHD-type zinc finger domain-containing protein [Chloropicon primus]|eukprot:QDZ17608.1 RING/FYVE/PHD-type zinc finger domain-containing protein [Chloropicon primus]